MKKTFYLIVVKGTGGFFPTTSINGSLQTGLVLGGGGAVSQNPMPRPTTKSPKMQK